MSRDHTTALQPGQESETESQKKKLKNDTGQLSWIKANSKDLIVV